MTEILQDLRSFVHSLRRRPLQAAVAVAILSIGLTSTLAVFTYVNGFYQPFPGVEPDRLMRVYGAESDQPYQPDAMTAEERRARIAELEAKRRGGRMAAPAAPCADG